jgi:hypothetical protein
MRPTRPALRSGVCATGKLIRKRLFVHNRGFATVNDGPAFASSRTFAERHLITTSSQMKPDRTPHAAVRNGEEQFVIVVDITADLNDEDDTGLVWTFLDEARDPAIVVLGAIVVAGDTGAPAVAEVVDLVDKPTGTIVHLRLLPGVLDDYEALIQRSTLPTLKAAHLLPDVLSGTEHTADLVGGVQRHRGIECVCPRLVGLQRCVGGWGSLFEMATVRARNAGDRHEYRPPGRSGARAEMRVAVTSSMYCSRLWQSTTS